MLLLAGAELASVLCTARQLLFFASWRLTLGGAPDLTPTNMKSKAPTPTYTMLSLGSRRYFSVLAITASSPPNYPVFRVYSRAL